MENVIDIKKIFKDTWGYVGMPYPSFIIKGIPETYKAQDFKFEQKWSKYDTSNKSVSLYTKADNGSEVFMPVWLSEIDRDAKQYLLPNTMMSITSKKKVVITELVNRDATFKEEISLGDWEINIKGVIVGEDNSYPDYEVQMLSDWYKKRKSLNIQNARTAIHLGENEKVVVLEVRFPELRGFENTQSYEIRLLSDITFDLYIE